MNETLPVHALKRAGEMLGAAAEQLLSERPFLSPSAVRLRAKHLRRRADRLSALIEGMLLWEECVNLAYLERTGTELMPGEEYSAVDANRAVEILKLYPKASK